MQHQQIFFIWSASYFILVSIQTSLYKKHKKTQKNQGNVLKNDTKITLVFQLEEVCGINIVAHKMKNVSGGI